jgi:PST family polysaccharide transporter
VVVFLATILSPRAFGVMALAMVWVGLAQMLASHGPTLAVIQREEVTDAHFNAAFWTTLGGSVVFAIGYAAAAPLWATANGATDLIPLCWALAPAIVLNGLAAIPDAFLRRQMQFKKLSVRVLISGLVSGVAAAVVAMLGYGVWALVVQQLTLSLVSAITVWAVSPWRPSFTRFGKALRDLHRFSLLSLSEMLAFFLQSRTDALLLGMYFDPASIGLYRFAGRITDTITELASSGLGQVSLPYLSRFSTDRQAFAVWLSKMIHLAAVLALPAFGVLAVCAPDLLPLIGPQWQPAIVPLQILCFDAAMGVLGSMVSPAVQAAGRPGFTAKLSWTQAIVTCAVVTGVGLGFRHTSAAEEVLVIAITLLSVRLTFLAIVIPTAFVRVFKVPMAPVLRPSLPALGSALTAVAVGLCLQPLLDRVPVFGQLAIVGSVATLAGATVLLLTDRLARSMVPQLLRRLRGAKPAAAAAGIS